MTAAFGLLALSLALTAVCPAPLLLAGPLLLGVPHVLADLRVLPWTKAVLAATVVLAFAAPYFPRVLLVFAYTHNFVAAAAWAYLSRDRSRTGAALLAYAAVCLAILGGALDFAAVSAAGSFSVASLGAIMAPGLAGPWPARLVLMFAFTQAFHYAVWLVLVPRETGVAVWGGGRALSWTAAAATILVAACGAARPPATRDAYLTLAGFHGWFELAALARIAV